MLKRERKKKRKKAKTKGNVSSPIFKKLTFEMGSPNLLDDQDSLFGPKLKNLAMKTNLVDLDHIKVSPKFKNYKEYKSSTVRCNLSFNGDELVWYHGMWGKGDANAKSISLGRC